MHAAQELAMTKPAEPANSKVATLPFWIAGRRQVSTGTRVGDVSNPATGAVVRHVAFANANDVDAAVQAASAAFPTWRATPPLRRARILQEYLNLMRAHHAELARLASEEHGKTIADAMGSVQRGIEVIEFACGIPQLLKGEHAENVGTGVDCHRSRRSTFRPWCRCGCFRWRSPAATRSC
jgi:malonate-semialdehyde dehydrogenase (acetylating) / methylmalonate-semialdehyde dehydrogenase